MEAKEPNEEGERPETPPTSNVRAETPPDRPHKPEAMRQNAGEDDTLGPEYGMTTVQEAPEREPDAVIDRLNLLCEKLRYCAAWDDAAQNYHLYSESGCPDIEDNAVRISSSDWLHHTHATPSLQPPCACARIGE